MVQDSQKVDTVNLSSAFPRQFPSSRDVVEISQLAGDASSRCYYRIKVKNQAHTLILQTSEAFDAKEIARHPFLSILRALKSWGVSVPTLQAASPERGWVLLEDLGDETLQHSKNQRHYRATIDELVLWTVSSLTHARDLPHFNQAFDFEKLQAEMKFMATHFIDGLLKSTGRVFLDLVEPNSRYLDACPRFLAHRDYHSRNVMLRDDKVYLIDFQDARVGPVTYDIVSLLWDPYVRLTEDWRTELLAYWHSSLRRAGVAAGLGELTGALEENGDGSAPRWRVELERMKIQRLLKAVGTYASQYQLKGRADYLDSIRPALDGVREALAKIAALGASRESDAKLLAFIESLNLAPVDILIRSK